MDETSNNNDLTNNNSAVFSDDAPFEGGTTSTSTDTDFIYLYEGNIGTSFANPYALTTVSTTTSTVDYVYDNNGNQTTNGTWTNTWDYNNRLVSSTNGISTSTYSYDQSGQRVKKTENGTVSIYPNKYYSIENGAVKKHIFAGDLELASVEGTTTTYHHTDHLSGSSVETDEEGYVIEVLDYYPFGETRLDETYTDYENKKKFTGHEYDSDTGLYYMNARYQDPEVGRFVSIDPLSIFMGTPEAEKISGMKLSQLLADPQNLNSYSYVKNNPLRYTDPDGQAYLEISFSAEFQPLGVMAGVQIDKRGIDWVAGAGVSVGKSGSVQVVYSSGDLSHKPSTTASLGAKGAYILGLGVSRNRNIPTTNDPTVWNEISAIGGMGTSASLEIKKSGLIKLFNNQQDNNKQSVQQTTSDLNPKKENIPSQIKNTVSPNQCVDTNSRIPLQKFNINKNY